MFMKIAAGYEVLREEESRAEYDYMLDHPEERMNLMELVRRREANRMFMRGTHSIGSRRD